VINYPHRGIGDTTVEKLTIAANHYKRSIFEVMEHIDKIDLKLNSGTKNKIHDFVNMIKSFQIINENQDAFYVTEHVTKKTGLIQELKKDGTPEGVARVENIEELMNGIKDFTEGQKEIDGARGALTEFLEDVALATDLDKDTGDEDRVALMTIHLAKGLEFPYVFIVGINSLFFSTRSLFPIKTCPLERGRDMEFLRLKIFQIDFIEIANHPSTLHQQDLYNVLPLAVKLNHSLLQPFIQQLAKSLQAFK
jgi:DNA helicase-2/ATP-dependent DNA helicase PcrA